MLPMFAKLRTPFTRLFFRFFLQRDAMHKRRLYRHAVSDVTFRSKTVTVSSDFFSPAGNHAILVFPYQTSWQYSDGNPPNGGVECRCSRQKSCFPTSIWLHRRLQVVTLIAGSKRRSLLMAGDDDEMFMTRSLNVTPKTT